MKCVVPIITACTPAGSNACWACRPSSAATMPEVTSSVVAALTAASTRSAPPESIRTASVLVPPTSMPMRMSLLSLGVSRWLLIHKPGRRASVRYGGRGGRGGGGPRGVAGADASDPAEATGGDVEQEAGEQ